MSASTTPTVDDPLLSSSATTRVCGNCGEKEASLSCDSCELLLCTDCSRTIHKAQKNRNHRIAFLKAKETLRSGDVTPTRTSDDIEDLYSRIGAALAPNSLGEQFDPHIKRGDSAPSTPARTSTYKMAAVTESPASSRRSTGSGVDFALHIEPDDYEPPHRIRRRRIITFAVMVVFWLVCAMRSFVVNVLVSYASESVSIFDTVQSVLQSFGYLAIKFGLLMPVALLFWIVRCDLRTAVKRGLLNPWALLAGGSAMASALSYWWLVQGMGIGLDNNFWWSLAASAAILVALPSLFWPKERVTVRLGVICFNVFVGGALAYWNPEDPFSPQGNWIAIILQVLSAAVFPALAIFFTRLSVLYGGSSKTLFGMGVMVLTFAVPITVLLESDIWLQVQALDWRWQIRLAAALLADVIALVTGVVLACVLELLLLAFFVGWVAVTTSNMTLIALVYWWSYDFDLFHLGGGILLLLSFVYFVLDIHSYLKVRNRFL